MLDPVVEWALDPENFLNAARIRREQGYRIVSIAAFGTASDPRYAAVFHRTPGHSQVVVLNVERSALTQEVADKAAMGLFLAYVGGASEGPSNSFYACVFEPQPDASLPLPKLIRRQGWNAFSAAIQGAEDVAVRVRSLTVLSIGEPYANPYDPGTDVFLEFVATLWPQQTDRPFSAWGVRFDSAISPTDGADWNWSWETQVMRSHSNLMAVARTPESLLRGGRVLQLWQDVKFEPWPIPDPFSFDPMALADRLGFDRVDSMGAQSAFNARVASGWTPISIQATGESEGAAHWELVFVASVSGEPIRRSFLRDGPGDGILRRDGQGSHVGATSVMNSHAATRSAFQIYEGFELRPGHTWVAPRMPGARPGPPGTPEANRDFFPEGSVPELGSSDARKRKQDSGLETATGLDDGALSATGSRGLRLAAEALAPYVWHPFDYVMRDLMLRGARAAYLVVLRGGKLKFARAYTYAETGYPVTRLHHRMRLASVTKAITATMVLRHYEDIAGGLSNKLAAELGVTPTLANLRDATVLQTLRHASGLAGNVLIDEVNAQDLANLPEGVAPGGDPAETYAGQPIREFGTFRKWLRDLDRAPEAPFQPGTHARYSNLGISLLAEAVGRRSTYGAFGSWPYAYRDQLLLAGLSIQYVVSPRSRQGTRNNGETPYHWRPGTAATRWRTTPQDGQLAEEPLPFVPIAYNNDMAFFGGGGGMALSAIELARFLSALTPQEGRFRWHSNEQLALLKSVDPSLEGGPAQPLGWDSATEIGDWPTATSATRQVTRLVKNGGIAGTGAWMMHQLSASPSGNSSANDSTLSMGLAINRDAGLPGNQLEEGLVRVARTLEDTGTWPSGDLFDDP